MFLDLGFSVPARFLKVKDAWDNYDCNVHSEYMAVQQEAPF
jgi:hypothetical protein